jgi:hypothetical protein
LLGELQKNWIINPRWVSSGIYILFQSNSCPAYGSGSNAEAEI